MGRWEQTYIQHRIYTKALKKKNLVFEINLFNLVTENIIQSEENCHYAYDIKIPRIRAW